MQYLYIEYMIKSGVTNYSMSIRLVAKLGLIEKKGDPNNLAVLI